MGDRLYNNIPYGLVHKNVMKDNKISVGAKALYSYLCVYAGSGNSSFPSRDLITYELNITKDTFSKYLKELKESDYIEVVQEKQEGAKFSHNVYYMTPDKQPCHKKPDTEISDTEKPDTEKQDTKNNNLTNNNIKNNKDIYIDEIWNLYPNKQGKANSIKKIPGIVKDIGIDKLKQCIENYKNTVAAARQTGFNQQYMNGSTFFNGRYMDYMEEIKVEIGYNSKPRDFVPVNEINDEMMKHLENDF